MCSKKNEEKSYLFLISIAFLSIHGLTRCLFCIWHKWLDFLWNILVCKMLMTLKCERRETFGLNWSGKVVYITEYLFLFQGFLYTSNTSFPATLYLRDFKDIITYRCFSQRCWYCFRDGISESRMTYAGWFMACYLLIEPQIWTFVKTYLKNL